METVRSTSTDFHSIVLESATEFSETIAELSDSTTVYDPDSGIGLAETQSQLGSVVDRAWQLRQPWCRFFRLQLPNGHDPLPHEFDLPKLRE